MNFRIFQVHFSASPWVFALSLIALAILAALCVVAIRRSQRPVRAVLLEGTRFLVGCLVVALLWQPEWRTQKIPTSKPEVVILTDASLSMKTVDARLPMAVDPRQEVVSRSSWIDRIMKSDMFAGLNEQSEFTITEESFSAPPADADDELASMSGTDIRAALENTLESRDNLLAVIMLTDGDWNEGGAPVAAAQKMRSRKVPLFAIPVGSQTRLPDLELAKVTAPTYGIIGENVQIPFIIKSSLQRDVRTTVRLRDINSKLEVSKSITIPAGAEYHDAVLWRIQDEQNATLEISIPVAQGEVVESNNSRQFTISGRNESIKVLVIDTLPRWEYRFIRNALYRDPGVDVDCLMLHPQLGTGDGPGYIQQFPEDLEELQKYDVVFLGDVGIGNDQLTSKQAELLRGLVEQQASGIVFIPGPQGNQFTLMDSPLGDLIPVIMDAKQKEGIRDSVDSKLNLTSQGAGSLLTMLGDTEEENPEIWKNLPGFYWHAPVIKAKGGTDVLGVHANRRNQSGNRIPLLVTQLSGNGKVLFLGHDSAWRWRRGVEDLYHYRFWGQVARWMSYQRNMAAGERVRMYFTPDRPAPGETVTINANAFDENGAPLESGEVIVDVIDPAGKTQRMALTRAEGAWGAYSGRVKINQTGAWKVNAFTTLASDKVVESTLIAQGAAIEMIGQPARPEVLDELSRISQGRVLQSDKLSDLIREIGSLPAPKPLETRTPLWSHWLSAVVIISLLGLFWIGRKLNGTF
ncbi:VWA domain-containing protein [Persicirhabdus sediminis]|uniref:VWFA domain-containing protein n=1 Tax=Persicirhabdus sediminis TaxID=454144 RepID=A0A8J7SJP3_9BACT|nr:VWA domain-containing protein [Persicirhabdus sediminis]MBK1791489.1 hypothetical protein [Persicirhabdus sediminis]